MNKDSRYNRFLIAEALFALLCVLRFWDRRMLPHRIGFGGGASVPFLQNYYVMVVATAVYFFCILLFSRWALRRALERSLQMGRHTEYLLSLLALFLFPAYLSEHYFGAADIFALICLLGFFFLFEKIGLSVGWLAAVFTLLQLPLLGDAATELPFLRFVITAVFFLAVLWYWKRRYALSPFVFLGLPMGVVWVALGDYDRGLCSLMSGFAFAWLYLTLPGTSKADAAEGTQPEKPSLFWEPDGEPSASPVLLPVVLLLCIALFVIFWMYGEPLLLEEEILEY